MDTLYLLIGIAFLALVCAVCLAFSGVRTGGRTVPEPPEHLRPKGSVPRMRNPPMPPAISTESMRLSLENSRKADKAYKKMIAQLEDAKEAEINNKSRKKFNELTLTLSLENREKYLDALKLKK